MNSLNSIRIRSAILLVGAISALQAQSVTTAINLPAQRESTLDLGRGFLASRDKEKVEYQNPPDPFIGKVAPVVADATVDAAPVTEMVVNEVELLRNLASRISARGTAILGEDRFLLLSQKRLKVGETTTISFDGKDYEVLLSDLTSTTFTIKRNDLTFTRPVLPSR